MDRGDIRQSVLTEVLVLPGMIQAMLPTNSQIIHRAMVVLSQNSCGVGSVSTEFKPKSCPPSQTG
jgi:hypothetical protein